MRMLRLALLAAGVALALSGTAAAQSGRNIRVIVPYPPGGSADVLARVLSQEINAHDGVNLVVENRPGAGTVTATDFVSRQPADGNTVLVMSNSFVINSHMRKLNYDPLKSFAPVCNLVTSPNLIVVNATSPYKTLGDLIAASKAKPGAITVASVGPATTQHVGFLQLNMASQAQMTFVPFPGGAPAVNALLGDHVTAVYGNYQEVGEHLKSGKLRALAVASRERSSVVPELPTMAEAGFPGVVSQTDYALYAPVATPRDIVLLLNRETNAVLKLADLRAKLAAQGIEVTGGTPESLQAELAEEVAKWGRVIAEAKIKPE
jgi:tripartite-type tricarboxylate transporter receptor subunit TctC